MVWVSGHLDDEALTSFLQRAKVHLMTKTGPSRRKTKPGSFIFLFDNVLEAGEVRKPELGQSFRTEQELEAIIT